MARKIKAEYLKQKNLVPVRVTDSELDLMTRAAVKARLPLATFARLAAITNALAALREEAAAAQSLSTTAR